MIAHCSWHNLTMASRVLCVMLTAAIVTLPLETTAQSVRSRRSDDAGPLEAVMQNLSQQLSLLNAEVAALKSTTSRLDKAVAFYAVSDANPLKALAHGTLIFPHAYTNVGNGYDNTTGVLTTPFSGLYDLQLTAMGYYTTGYVNAGIYVDGRRVAYVLADNRHGMNYQQASTRALVHVSAGSKVSVRNDDIATKNFYGGLHTTFSGFLVKAD